MIVYRLKCANGHVFDSWFRDSKAFDTLAGQGEVPCPVCGSLEVQKAPMAPNLATRRADDLAPAHAGRHASGEGASSPAAALPAEAGTTAGGPAAIMARMEMLARALRANVEANCDNVGERFAEEARLMHYGEVEERGIYGQAKADEVKDLLEEGIPVLPLPDPPEKAN